MKRSSDLLRNIVSTVTQRPAYGPRRAPTTLRIVDQASTDGSAAGAKLAPAERAALIARLDTRPTRADWALYSRVLEVML